MVVAWPPHSTLHCMALALKRGRRSTADYQYFPEGEVGADGKRVYRGATTGKAIRLLATPPRELSAKEHTARLKPLVDQLSRMRKAPAAPQPPRSSAVAVLAQRTSEYMAIKVLTACDGTPPVIVDAATVTVGPMPVKAPTVMEAGTATVVALPSQHSAVESGAAAEAGPVTVIAAPPQHRAVESAAAVDDLPQTGAAAPAGAAAVESAAMVETGPLTVADLPQTGAAAVESATAVEARLLTVAAEMHSEHSAVESAAAVTRIVSTDLIDASSGLPRAPAANEALLEFDVNVGSVYQQVVYAGFDSTYRVTSSECLQHAFSDTDLGTGGPVIKLGVGSLLEVEFLVFQCSTAATDLLSGYTRLMARRALIVNEVGGIASVRIVAEVGSQVAAHLGAGPRVGAMWRAHLPANGGARVMERRVECGETLTAHISGNMAVVPHYGSDIEELTSRLLQTVGVAAEATGRFSFVYYLQAGTEAFLIARMNRVEGGYEQRRKDILKSARPSKKEQASVLVAEKTTVHGPATRRSREERAAAREGDVPRPAATLASDASLTLAQRLRFTPAMRPGGWYHAAEADANEMIRANFGLEGQPSSEQTAAFVPERLDFPLDVDKLRRTAAAQWTKVCKAEAAKTNTVRRASSDRVGVIERIT